MEEASTYFADQAWFGKVSILENIRLAKDTYRLRLSADEIARRVLPGQFVMLRIAGCDDPLLGRPLAMYDVVQEEKGTSWALDVVFLVVGRMTGKLAQLTPGTTLEIWGPLGNGFTPRPVDNLIMVAGGIGQTPFLSLAKEYLGLQHFARSSSDSSSSNGKNARVVFCYGARNAQYLAGVEDFRRLGVDVRISTDDGSSGHKGFVTELLEKALTEFSGQKNQVVCCGPEPMMHRVAEICLREKVPCELSLETPMACGVGICFSCVTRVKDEQGGWDYRRTCVEGPIFNAEKLELKK